MRLDVVHSDTRQAICSKPIRLVTTDHLSSRQAGRRRCQLGTCAYVAECAGRRDVATAARPGVLVMIIRSIRLLDGPNIYLYRPVLVMELDLEELTDRETREIPGLNERLLALLPGLHEHVCGLGVRGGLVQRLEGGTYFGHVIEHVALGLSTPAGVPVNFGKTRVTSNPRVYNVIVEATAPSVMRLLLHVAVDLVGCLAKGEEFSDLPRRLDEARRLLDRTAMGPSTAAIAGA